MHFKLFRFNYTIFIFFWVQIIQFFFDHNKLYNLNEEDPNSF